MIVNVRMKDGRTTFQFASRKDLNQVLNRDVAEDTKPVIGWIHTAGDDRGWRQLRVNVIGRGAVAFVVASEDVADSDQDLPAKELAESRQRHWAERQAESAETGGSA